MSFQFTVDGLAMKQTDSLLVEGNGDEDWFAYAHQKRARDIWSADTDESVPESYIALNHAPTGAGKTMSWADPAVRTGDNVLAMYPTKALINDQFDTLKEIFENKYDDVIVNGPTEDPEFSDEKTTVGFARFTSDSYDTYREELPEASSRNGELFAQITRRLDKQNDVVIALTNPDIFSYVRHDVYQGSLARRVSGMFDALIVDEFHHADVKGQHSLVFLLEQMRREAKHKSRTQKCMLLSATPEREIQDKLASMKAPYFDLNEEGDTRPQSLANTDENWRTVLPPVNLTFRRSSTFKTGEKLIDNDNIQDTVDFCGRDERTVIILDSLGEVEQVAWRLERHLGDSHYIETLNGQSKNIGEKIQEFNSSDAAVLVTNSAGEIGIDYKADQLIFSGSNPSKLMQRFGRLRNRTEELEAIAYVPNRAYERFKTAGVEDSTVTREEFEVLVDDGYEETREPSSFPPTFGAHEAFMQVQSVAEGSGPEERDEILEEGFEMIENQFFKPYGIPFDQERFERNHDEMSGALESLKDFRSSSPTALVYNKRDDKVYTYSIEPLLRTGDVDVVEEDEFFGRIPEKHHEEARKKSGHAHGFIIWRGNEKENREDNPQPRSVSVLCDSAVDDMLRQPVEQRIPKKIDYFQYVVKPNDLSIVDIGPINDALADNAEPLGYAVEADRYTLQSALGLDDFFFLTSVAGPSDDVSVALSHEAMYLYCIKQENLYKNDPTKDIRVHIPEQLKEEVLEVVN